MGENRWSFGRQLYWGLIFFLVFAFLSLFFFDESERFKNLFELSLGLLAVLVACYSKRGLKILKYRPSFRRQTRWLQWLGLGCLLYMMLVGHVFSSIYALFFDRHFLDDTLVALGAATLEEGICRGFLLSGFLGLAVYYGFKRKLVWASFAAAVTFSGFHLINLLGTPVTVVSQQLFYSLAMGVFLAASYFATNNLLVPLGIHFLLDWGPSYNYQPQPSSWLTLLAVFLPLLLVSSWYLFVLDWQVSDYF